MVLSSLMDPIRTPGRSTFTCMRYATYGWTDLRIGSAGNRRTGPQHLTLSLGLPLKCNNGGTIMSVNIHLLLTILVLNNVTLFQVQPKYSELTSLALGDSDVRRGSWYIRLLAVHPDSQRRGLARRLLEVFKTKVFIPWYSKSVACIRIPLTLH